jgi:hypothetical protein
MARPKGGRPRKEISPLQLKAFMRIKPTLEDTAAFFNCSTDTIDRFVKANFDGISFAAFRDQNMVSTRHDLIREAIRRAMKGSDTMLIFSLKNLCGWKDRQDIDATDLPGGGITIRMAYDPQLRKDSDDNERQPAAAATGH